MAGDWIKMGKDLRDDPAIIGIASLLTMDPDMVVGKLHRFWSWCDTHLADGNARFVTGCNAHVTLDVQVGAQGFAQALESVGWLVLKEDGFTVPNYDRHLSQSAKRRAVTTNRVALHRKRHHVTPKALPEKRREECISSKKKYKTFTVPTIDAVALYCAQRRNGIDAEAFVNHYTSKGWVVGKSPMKDWQAAVRTWEKNRRNEPSLLDLEEPGV